MAETKVVGGLPVPWTGGQSTFTPTIDAEGYSTWRGQHFIKTIDLTSTKVNPRIVDGKATHRVTFRNVKAGALDVKFEQRSVRLAADMAEALDATAAAAYGLPTGTLVCDLTKLLPVPVANWVPIVVGPQGPPGDPTLTDEVTATNIETGDLTKAALGSEIATTGTPAEVAVAANIATRIRAGLGIVNALDPLYGIKGDGTTDDTVAINTLLAACPRGTHVLFPRAEYRITDYILMKRDVHIHGAGVSANIGDVAELEGGEATFIGVPRNAPTSSGLCSDRTVQARTDSASPDQAPRTSPTSAFASAQTSCSATLATDSSARPSRHQGTTATASGARPGRTSWSSATTATITPSRSPTASTTTGPTSVPSVVVGFTSSTTASVQPPDGNWVFPNICVQLFATGTAHGVLVNNVTAQFNFLLFGRLQIMIYDRSSVFAAAGVPNAAVQKHIEGLGVGMIENLRIEQPDFESNVGAGPASALSSGRLRGAPASSMGSGRATRTSGAAERATHRWLSARHATTSPRWSGTHRRASARAALPPLSG
ncbi:glycosyl hydrolase family 28-related protein [Aeromicrobium sp. UC242_57]|uniref:glycosyl hydrolase family 28-related protein n=1 Tax=Aeromicrobium sp. UC242_57 TaxID=3374624 RepID=UPI00378ACA76